MAIKKTSVFILVVFCKYVSCYLRVCYYTNWSQYRPEGGRFTPDNVDPTLCTHIIFAFAKLNGTNLAPFEWNDESAAGTIGMYDQINNMKKRNPALKTLLAVGGWNAGSLPFSDLVASRESRQAFVNSTLVYLRERMFNGLDIDWEYPASRGGRPADKQNLVALLSELRRAFEQESYHTGKERLLLTCAVPAGKSNIDAGYDVPNIARSLDFINIMTYDMHGSWETVTGHNSPLYGRVGESAESALLNMDWTAKYWLRNGAPKHRLILGFGLYGRSFKLSNPAVNGMGALTVGAGRQGNYTKEAGFMAYYEVCEELKKGAVRVWDPEHKIPYLYKDDLWVGYDDEESIREKIKWLKEGGYGGVMVWSLALDDFSGTFCNRGRYPLLTMIKNELQKPAPAKSKPGTPKANIGASLVPAAMPPVVVSDRVQRMGNNVNSGHQELTLPSGLAFKNHNQPRQNILPNDLSMLSIGPNHVAHNIVPTQTQPLSPSSEVVAGQTKSAPLDTSVLINVPPSVAQIIQSTHPKNIASVTAVHQDLTPLSSGTVLSQPIQNNLPVAVIHAMNAHSPMIIPDTQPIQPVGNINGVQPAPVGAIGGMPPGTIVDIANALPAGLPQANIISNVNSIPGAPIDAGMPLIVDANRMADTTMILNAPVGPQAGIGTVDVVAQPPMIASVPQPPVALIPVIQAAAPVSPIAKPTKPKVNFSFTSSSSSTSNSSSSSSNSSSSSTVELPQRLSIAQAIQNAIQGSPSDAVIITDLPSNGGMIATAPLGAPAAGPTIIAAPPALQLGGGNAGAVIPVTSVSNLEELLSNLNTNIPTAGTILLPEPNNDLTPTMALRELSLGNALDSFGLGTVRSAPQPRRPQSATRQVAVSIPTARPVLQSSFDPIQPRSSSLVPIPRSRGTATTGRNNRALIEAIRRNPELRARIIAARRRAQALAAARARSRAPFTSTSARSRSPSTGTSTRIRTPPAGTSARFQSALQGRQLPVQVRSRSTRFQTPRARSRQMMPTSEQLRRRQLSRLAIQRSPGAAPVTRQTFSPSTRRRLSPAQVRAIRTLMARRSGSTLSRTIPRVVRRPTPTRVQSSGTFVSPTRSSIPRNILSQFRGLT